MQTMLVVVQDSVSWAVQADDPPTFELASSPGCAVVNPALYPCMVKVRDLQRELIAKPTFIDHGVFYFVSNLLFLAVDEDESTLHWTPGSGPEWERRISALINHLRFASKQASLKPRLKTVGPSNPPCLPAFELPEKGEDCFTASWHLRTAVRGEHIVRAGQQPLDTRPPSYSTFLLDAIDSLMHGDCATAFVLASISMDHLARAKAADGFVAAFQADSDRSLILGFPTDTAPEARKERTEALSNLLLRERRFKQLLHSVPLALTGRSLLLDDKDLYDKALQIYEMRNRVVHNDIAFKDEFLPRFFGCDEAIDAVRCAIGLAGWFGAESNYAHPFDGMQNVICARAKL